MKSLVEKSTYNRVWHIKQLTTYITVNIICVTGTTPSDFCATNSAHHWGKIDLLTFVSKKDNLGGKLLFLLLKFISKNISLTLTFHPPCGSKSLMPLSQVFAFSDSSAPIRSNMFRRCHLSGIFATSFSLSCFWLRWLLIQFLFLHPVRSMDHFPK